MKSLQESLLDDEDVLMQDTGDFAVKSKLIKDYIEENYIIISGNIKINKDYTVDCSGDLMLQDWVSELTNGMFTWGKVNGFFNCSGCYNLKSLYGAPKIVSKYFYCSDCCELTSLEGSPEEVGGDFDCSECSELTSLKGAPKHVNRDFNCDYCRNLKTFAGAPKKVGEDFNCMGCDKIKKIRLEIAKYSNVRGEIYF